MTSKDTAKRGPTALPKDRGTGFEDGFADPPVTPNEHMIELEIYDSLRPFHERIEDCIQRYTARRRLSQARAQLFAKYLYLGGIDTTQRQFTGTAQHVKDWKGEGYGPEDLRAFTANEFLGRGGDSKGLFYNPDAPEHWDVDFAGVVAGFLGSYLPEQTYADSPEISLAADTILNFLKYVRHHDVCPEYTENITRAMEICDQAVLELSKLGAVGCAIPGDFNLACRVLFCSTGVPLSSGDFKSDFQLYEDKETYELSDGKTTKFPGALDSCMSVPADFDSELVFKTAIALHEPEHIARINDPANPPRVFNVFEEVYEVQDVVYADQRLADIYDGITKNNQTMRPIEPVGQIVLAPAIIEDGWDNHPTQAEGRADNPGKPVSLYMDHNVLEHLSVGMRMRVTVCELDLGGGLAFIKEVAELVPSFHVYLPQSLMMHYKPPRPETRPPPSAEDPDVEEQRMLALVAGEEDGAIRELRKADPELDRNMQEMGDVEALEEVMAHNKI